MKPLRSLILIFFFPMILHGMPPMQWFEEIQFENDENYYDKDDWVKVRDLINNKAPSLRNYLDLFANEGVKQSSFDKENFDTIEDFCDEYINNDAADLKNALIAHAQNTGACWIPARRLLDTRDDQKLKNDLEEKISIAAKSQVDYILIKLIFDKIELRSDLDDTARELENTVRTINQIETDKDAAVKEAAAGLLVDLTESTPLALEAEAPDITVNDLQSKKQFNLSELRGQVVYLDFWATWCGPCQKPMEHLNQLSIKHAEDWKGNVQLVGISLDDDAETAMKHLQKKSWLSSRQAWPDKGFESIATKKYRIKGIPSAFLINREGKIVWMGHPGEVDLEKEIGVLLKEK